MIMINIYTYKHVDFKTKDSNNKYKLQNKKQKQTNNKNKK